jgi:hypothetical protein
MAALSVVATSGTKAYQQWTPDSSEDVWAATHTLPSSEDQPCNHGEEDAGYTGVYIVWWCLQEVALMGTPDCAFRIQGSWEGSISAHTGHQSGLWVPDIVFHLTGMHSLLAACVVIKIDPFSHSGTLSYLYVMLQNK